MNMKIFTVFDSAALAYLEPFFAPTLAVALRMFTEICQKEGHQFNKHPECYALFHIGQFHQETGKLQAEATPMSLGLAIEFVGPPHVVKLEEAAHG